MCEHCGCRGVEPIADLMDEHLELLELAGDVRRHLVHGDREAVREGLVALERLLDDHVRREERGVFAAMKAQGDFADAVLDLETEHDSFAGSLGTLDPDSPDFGHRVRRLLEELSTHIDKENLGVFPAAVVTLGASGWDVVSRAHAEHAHPHAHPRPILEGAAL
jgi:iron-sulfur cluster repair protein YtfE (RIC family)